VSRRRRNLEPVPPEFLRRTRPEGHVRGVLFSEMARSEVRWLWQGRIPLGNITVLDGDPGLGKSVFTTDLAARVTVGRRFPDGVPCGTGQQGAGVVMLNAEDAFASTVGPRFDAAGGDSRRAVWLSEVPDEAEPGLDRPISLPEDIALLEGAIGRVSARLVIVDPLMAFLSGHTNAHKDQDIRHVLARLKSLAERTGAAVLLVRHLNKAAGGNPLYQGGGSIGIIGAARSGLIVAQDPDDPDGKRRVLASSKQNLSEPTPSLVFGVASSAANGAARVEWRGGSSLDAVELMRAPLEEEEKSALEEALEFLKDELSEGPMAAKQVKLNARGEGISERTLNRAKARLKVRSTKEAYGWTWTLPEVPGNQGGHSPVPGNLAGAPASRERNPACLSQDCQGCQHCQGGELKGGEKGDGNLDGWLDHPLDCGCGDCLYGPGIKRGKM
jgi:hypothetical protein